MPWKTPTIRPISRGCLFLWRANLLGASGKGHEYFLKHLLGVDNAVFNAESRFVPKKIDGAILRPKGKLDLLVTMELRMSTSALYADMPCPRPAGMRCMI